MVELSIVSGRYYVGPLNYTIRGIVTHIDAVHMKVYWYHSGGTEVYTSNQPDIMKQYIKVVNSG
jgi:hypothetical protein